jgi:pyrimidine operon attenuation protein/uracil phosphoribosyltransferase
VLYTGRTIRAVINELFDYGRPASVRWRCWWTAAGASCPCRPTLPPPRALPCRALQSLALARDDAALQFQGEEA